MKTLHLPHISLALTLAACSLETKPDNHYGDLLDAGRDAQTPTGEDDATTGDASQVHEGDASSTGNDAEVTKRPCDDACACATPYCDEASDTCVACIDSTADARPTARVCHQTLRRAQ